MKTVAASIMLLVCMFFAVALQAATYNATGRWNYSVTGHWNNCSEPPEPSESGTVVVVQDANTFLLVVTSSTANNLKTVSGTINGSTYKFSDRYWEDGGWTTETVSFTLSSASAGSGSPTWAWSSGADSCSGGYSLSISKQSQATPSYNASGTWSFSENDFWNTCGEANPVSDSGTITFDQNGSRISATDSQGGTWSGFVSGRTYTFVDSYAEDKGITSDVCTIDLRSAAQGSGQCWWVWDLNGNSNENCHGGSNVSITKQAETKSQGMPWLNLLLFDDSNPGGGGGIIPLGLTITSLPTTDGDGNYVLEWSATLGSSSWWIQEDSDTNFANPTTYLSSDTTAPYSYQFSNKPNGTYCYRVGYSPSGPFSKPACVTVNIAVQTRQITIKNQITAGLNLQQVVQVKVSPTNSFSRSDRLTDDPAHCLYLPGEAIDRGGSRTFDITTGENYYVFIGIGTWDLDNVYCSYLYPWFKRRFFTEPGTYYTYYVYTIVSVNGHSSGNWDWTISGSYLNGTLVVTPSGNSSIHFTVTRNNPIP